MDINEIKVFFQERPSLNKTGFCQEVGISKGLLDMMLRDDRSLTEETKKKLLPILKKYGYKKAK
jgi:hypothetical protein